MRVAVLGMGSMGRALAGRLVGQGHSVTVWNRTPGRAADVVALGAGEAASPATAAGGAEAVVVSLAADEAVRSVVLGDGGAASALGAGVLVDASTVAPETSRALSAALGASRMVAAPVLGGPAAVSDGSATYLLGGPQTTVEALDPLWRSLSGQRRWCGEDPGRATTLKVLSNYLLMAGIAVLGEVVATGQAAGLDDALLVDYLGNVPLVAPGLRNRLDDMVHGDHQGWFSVRLGAKDVGLVEQLGASVDHGLPLAAAVQQRYQAAIAAGLGDADIAAIVELGRRTAPGG